MIGQTISHYKILEKLGEGGMGVVYKAHDSSLDRFVALKFLPPHVAASADDKARFLQEAKAVASLAHPNICTIYSVEEEVGKAFIVMEYVEGKTLKDLGQNLQLKQAIEIGIQSADGLAAAHDKGVVHRDIKPDNIMIRKDGRVQIMDFGLAKLRGVSRLTKQGTTVGTAGYMSPEQVQDLEVDHRTDIFSLGVVLYEMFAGVSPFKGVHETAIAYEIVNVEPASLSVVKPEIDKQLDGIVLECLVKEPAERYQSAAEVSKELRRFKRESGRSGKSSVTAGKPLSSLELQPAQSEAKQSAPWKGFVPWGIAAVLALILVISVISQFSSSADRAMITAVMPPPERTNFYLYGDFAGPAALSPDGKRLAFVATDSTGKPYLYVRSLDAIIAKRLDNTVGAVHPFWSPDNQFIGFFNYGKLKKIDASGGAPITICDGGAGRGGTWNSDGTIVFTGMAFDPLSVVSASGGTPAQLTKFDSLQKEDSHRWPSFLPDGKHFLYWARTVTAGEQGEGGLIRVGSLDGKVDKILVPANSNAVYASGYILYVRGTTLVAHLFDESSLELKGEPATLAEGVTYDPSLNRGMFTVSSNGILVYQTGVTLLGTRLILHDRAGKQTGTVGELAEYEFPRFSPDNSLISTRIWDYQSHKADIWIFDLARHQKTRFTFGRAGWGIWSPDGSRIIFQLRDKGVDNLYQKGTSETAGETLLLRSSQSKIPCDLSRDGKFLLYQEYNQTGTRSDLFVLPLTGNHEPVPFLQAEFSTFEGNFSPDGRWIAYRSSESGQPEVYIRSFQEPGAQPVSKKGAVSGVQRQVSYSRGFAPRWRGDGKEIYYVSPDKKLKMMAADISIKDGTLEVGQAHPLFEFPSIFQDHYDVTSDGKKFVINVPFEKQNQTPLTLVVNWDLAVKKK